MVIIDKLLFSPVVFLLCLFKAAPWAYLHFGNSRNLNFTQTCNLRSLEFEQIIVIYFYAVLQLVLAILMTSHTFQGQHDLRELLTPCRALIFVVYGDSARLG